MLWDSILPASGGSMCGGGGIISFSRRFLYRCQQAFDNGIGIDPFGISVEISNNTVSQHSLGHMPDIIGADIEPPA